MNPFKVAKRIFESRYYNTEVDRFELWAKTEVARIALVLKTPEVKTKLVAFIRDNNIEMNASNNHFSQGFDIFTKVLERDDNKDKLVDLFSTVLKTNPERNRNKEVVDSILHKFNTSISS